MIRTVFVLLYIVLVCIVTVPFLVLFLILRLFSPKLASALAQPFAKVVAFRGIFLVSGCRITVKGADRIPAGVPVLFAGNHRSMYDILAAYIAIPATHRTSFISKYEIRHVPFLSWWMRALNCKFLNRSNPKEGLKTIQSAIADVKDGFSMFIMPEGTRNHGDDLLPFKAGSLKIAERTGCPVIPVAMIGTDDILEKHFPKITAHHVTVIIGEPIPTADLSRDEKIELPDRVRTVIQDMILAESSGNTASVTTGNAAPEAASSASAQDNAESAK